MARRRRLTALVLAVACLALTVATGRAVRDDQEPPGPASSSASSEAAATSSPTATGAATPDTADTPDTTAPTETTTPGTAPPGAPPSDGEPTGPGGIEAAPDAGETRAPGEIVAEQQRRNGRPVVPAPAGDDAAEGTLVAGHPQRVLPLAPGSEVRTSSLSTSDGRVQVAVVAAGGSAHEILRFYREHLASFGFREVAVMSVPGTRSAAFRWRDSSALVTTGPEPGSYAVLATLRVEGS